MQNMLLLFCLLLGIVVPYADCASELCTTTQPTQLLNLPTSTGCIAALGQCQTSLTVTMPSNCSHVLPPYNTVVMFAGYQVPTKYYRTLAESLAASGFIALQYERADSMPSADVESDYWEPLMQWRSNINSSINSSLYGLFGSQVAVAGHSMGGALASVAAGSHANMVSTAFLMDPVDWDYMSNRVSASYLSRFNKPVVIVSIGVHCMDRAKCYGPTNCSHPISSDASSDGCEPSWWCCDWDHGIASASGRITPGARPQPNGAQSFWETAPVNSWQNNLPNAGHMSFLDYNPQTDSEQLLSCPYTLPHTDIQPVAASLLVKWMSHVMDGAPLGADWTSPEADFMMKKTDQM